MPHPPLAVTWRLRRTRLPRILHHCANCTVPSTFEPTGRFRVNANRKLLDVWLLLSCGTCGRSLKATVVERSAVRSISPALLRRYQRNDPLLVAEVLLAPSFRRRNRLTLDWTGTWELAADPLPWLQVQSWRDRPIRVTVELGQPVLVHPVQVLAAGLGISRTEVKRLIAAGRIQSSISLDSRTSTGFQFTVDSTRIT